MMAQKIFATKGRVSLVGDERDVAVDVRHRQSVWDYCHCNGIVAEYHGTLAWRDLWRVRDERQRVMFLLRWA